MKEQGLQVTKGDFVGS
ncbi:DUF3948 family protein, partial [Bacillus thuringiensis]